MHNHRLTVDKLIFLLRFFFFFHFTSKKFFFSSNGSSQTGVSSLQSTPMDFLTQMKTEKKINELMTINITNEPTKSKNPFDASDSTEVKRCPRHQLIDCYLLVNCFIYIYSWTPFKWLTMRQKPSFSLHCNQISCTINISSV